MKKLLYTLSAYLLFLGCINKVEDSKESNSVKESSRFSSSKSLDSLYLYNANIQVYVDKIEMNDTSKNQNYLIKVLTKLNDNYSIIFSDSIYSKTGLLKFEDFNGDNVPDILIQCQSDVRSNWTYNLYLVNEKNLSIEKVNEFSKIKNPVFIKNNNIVESYVISGKNYYEYFRILNTSICQFDTLIYDSMNLKDTVEWKKEHNFLIEKVCLLKCR